MKKIASIMLSLVLLVSFAGGASISKAKAATFNPNSEDSLKAAIQEQATITSDSNPVSDASDGIVQGRVVKFDHQFYSMDVTFSKVTTKDITLDYAINVKLDQGKAGGLSDLWCEGDTFVEFNEGSEVPTPVDAYEYYKPAGSVTISRGKLYEGNNFFKFKVNLTAKGGQQANAYSYSTVDIKVPSKGTGLDPSSYDFFIYKNSVTLGTAFKSTKDGVTESGTVVAYRTGSGDWKEVTFKNGATLSVNGLKANTKYEFKTKNYTVETDATGQEVKTESDFCEVCTVSTAANAPKIKSIKTSKVKQYKVNIPGQWKTEFGKDKYYPAHKEWRTSYKAKITLSAAPKNTAFMICKGSTNLGIKPAKTFTVNVIESGKKKGKKASLSVVLYSHDSGKGESKAGKKSFKVK